MKIESFYEVINKRRSVRRFAAKTVPEELIQNAIATAVLAPNSSNTQTWDFYWVKNADSKNKLIHYCLNQSAARTAAELVVITADPKKWKRSQQGLIDWAIKANAPKPVLIYYQKLIPITYRWGFLNSFALIKWIGTSIVGLFRPLPRGPNFRSELQLVAVKSAALAAQNFVLALTAEGLSTCMMEGFDESRVKSLLKLPASSRVVMVVAIGYEGEKAFWGPQYRLPINEVFHRV